ncbi:uncharacterized protein LOC107001389 [Solanum pennellii]|uniref:Uncharacterized protein LOC107001389 n=1 Tax=Solanum pennellii TaxID=28526 RepID=A0ABM1FCJ8_SOLPN|nr:uncharacterized protein LOC107001389 [Solanum pennellii]
MDALIENLKTHEMNKSHDLSKREAKKDKSQMLKFKREEESSEDNDMAYLTRRFQKFVRKNKGFRKGGNFPRAVTSNDTCHKCGKAGHCIRDCPLLKAENKEYQRPRSDYVVKKALAAWGDSSSESEDSEEPNDASMVVVHGEDNVFNEMFAFMAQSDEVDEEDKVTLLDFKQNLNTYTLKRPRRLANVLIDSVMDLTSERDSMNLDFESLNENRDKMGEKMKRKGESTSLQIELEENLKTTETKLALALERNDSLERDLVKLKKELTNILKWIKSSKLLSNVTNQSNYSKKGLVSERSSSQCWYMYSGCSKHMTGNIKKFLLLKALQGGGVSFGDGKKGYILGVGKVGKLVEEPIENVYHVSGLKCNLPSVSQICDKGNEFVRSNVWYLVPRPVDRTVIGTRWVFRNKLDERGVIISNKSRLVVQGYNQEEGNYDETFAPVSRMEAIRIFIAFANFMGFKLYQMDVKSAFLNGDLKEEVFVKQPPSFEDSELPNHVSNLLRPCMG